MAVWLRPDWSVSKNTRSPTLTRNSCWLPGGPPLGPRLPTPVDGLREQAARTTTRATSAKPRKMPRVGARERIGISLLEDWYLRSVFTVRYLKPGLPRVVN